MMKHSHTSLHSTETSSRKLRAVRWSWLAAPLALLLAVSLACSLPGLGSKPTPTSIPAAALPTKPPTQPTPTPQPLPPALVESSPASGEELALDGTITLYFNQPMQPDSVEAALQVSPSVAGALTWTDDATLVISPEVPLLPEQDITVNVDTRAQSQDGRQLYQAVSLSYRAAGYLRLAQSLPEADTSEVDPTSAVVAAFNRPIVPLGVDGESLPPAFTLEPSAQGRGEWLNTSTYVFYPEPGLQGGATYRVVIDPALKGVDGNPLQEGTAGWSFSTALPRLLTISPLPDQSLIRLDSAITMTFNVPMDPGSVQANFTLQAADGGLVAGKFTWSEDRSAFGYHPDSLLERSTAYQVRLNGASEAGGGSPLGADIVTNFYTVAPLEVAFSTPADGGQKAAYAGISVTFNGPIDPLQYEQFVEFSPRLPNFGAYWDETSLTLNIYGSFDPELAYTLRISPDLPDAWGGRLGQGTVFNFTSAPYPPQLAIITGPDVLFLTARDASLVAQATNLFDLPTSSGSVPLQDFIAMVSSENAYNLRQSYRPADLQSWNQALNLPSNRTQAVEVAISANGQPRSPGLYTLNFNLPSEEAGSYNTYLLVVSDVQVTFKLGPTDALVWAVDLRSGDALANSAVTLYASDGAVMGSGQTDAQGVFRTAIPALKNPYDTYYAVLGFPGTAGFGMAISTWSQGISGWEIGVPTDYNGPHLQAYLYSDRPIYRPGQTVYFRGVVRQAFNGRYEMPSLGSLPLTVYRDYSEEVATYDLPLSAFGTINGAYALPADARPGYYRLASTLDDFNISLSFQVAEYRKPEINLQVAFDQAQVLAGDALRATVNARYFFDAPAGNLPVQWTLYASPSYFELPGYQVGAADVGFLDAYSFPFGGDGLGMQIQQGTGTTDPQGLLSLELPSQAEEARQRYTLEVTAQDESGLPVSARAGLDVNPAGIYLGVRPEAWVGRAGAPTGFDVMAVDWEQNPAGAHALRAEFQKVEWVRDVPPPGELYFMPTFTTRYTPVGSTDFETSSQGQARLEFTPPEPGTYQLSITGEGARTDILLWVGGEGQVTWPNLPNQRLRLVADKSDYLPGETASIFVPNPFNTESQALVTVERSTVLRHEVVVVQPGGATLQMPLGAEDTPNVFFSVILLGRDENGQSAYRVGYLNLSVAPQEQVFDVTLTTQPQRAGPGDNISFDLQVIDSAGQPVQGEFSLAVVDLAALALADPNAPDIVPAFYGEQPLGVRTGIALAAYARQGGTQSAGMGGGGGDGVPVVRGDFPDTAVWMADILTDAQGRASVSAPLPDSLTTWKVVVRGVTADTRVGQAESEIVTSKDVLVRPVTPRFLVVGDYALMAAVVQNNTADALQADVSLQATGFTLDDPAALSQTVMVAAGGRTRVEWWGTAQDTPEADLVFSAVAQAGGVTYQDAARPTLGALPVLRYTSPQTFRTAGIMEEGGELLELVSLPRAYDASGGSLRLEMSSSLAGAALNALEVLENLPYECTEQTLARFLPNLETYRVMKAVGVENPDLQARLERTLQEGLARLQARQHLDGGWSWWDEENSDLFISAYVLFGLGRARDAGANVSEMAIENVINYLNAGLYPPEMSQEGWQLDRLAFIYYALQQSGAGSQASMDALYQQRARLAPWGQALLALALEGVSPGSPSAATLLSDLASAAKRSATGAHWEDAQPGWQNMSTPISSSAIVLFALAQKGADSSLVADAVRYLMASRSADGAWPSSYASAWSLMALAEVMRSTGELAGAFPYSAALNGSPLVSGQAGALAPLSAEVPAASLYPDYPNALVIQRGEGAGRLYYTAGLSVGRPVEDAPPLQRGISVQRAYYPLSAECADQDCQPLTTASPGERVVARVTLTLEQDAYYLMVEDFIPAGAEALDTSLKTSQQGLSEDEQPAPWFDARDPFQGGWGWWLFSPVRIYDDHLAWSAAYLPAGTYELTYTLVVVQPGDYRVLPARAWQFYFPEVQGASAGEVFSIQPR